MEDNLLTKRLLEMGYSASNHPLFVAVEKSWKEDPLRNFEGGFTFVRKWLYEQTFKTPCGLQCKGKMCHSGTMGYMGIEWRCENDMGIISCPIDNKDCKCKHLYLQGTGVLQFLCNVHMVPEEYRYDGSAEQLLELHKQEIQEKKTAFSQARHGRVCGVQMYFQRETQEWGMDYSPKTCAQIRCRGYCPILGRELDPQ